jgi:serine phosphatase RsbU (regulator of sigma subunit)
MSLRTRLILAFFLLSVVPMAAVTVYAYATNVEALRVAAEHEADLLAGELGQRMSLVTAQLSERVEHLMDIAELQSAADAAVQQSSAAATTSAALAPAHDATPVAPASSAAMVVTTLNPDLLSDRIAKSLGETAMLLNNVRMTNPRGGGGRGGGGAGGFNGRGGPPPAPGTMPPPPAAGGTPRPTPTSTPTATAMTSVTAASPMPSPPFPRGDRSGGMGDGRRGRPGGGGAGSRGDAQPIGSPQASPVAPQAPAMPTAPGAAVAPGQAPAQTVMITPVHDANGNLTIDMGPLRRDLFRQVLPTDKRYEDLSQEERQRVAAEVNQRLLGIQQGLQIGAAELQKRAVAAEKEAAAQEAAKKTATRTAAASTAKVPPAANAPADVQRRSSLSGSSIAVNVERNGTVVRTLNAELNLPNVLATVFSTTKRDRGEVPFAVAKDGTIYARSAADKQLVSSMGTAARPDGPTVVRLPDYVVVTTDDKSGSGLRLGIARPVGDSLANLRKTTARNAGLGLLFVVVALAGIVPLSSRLTRNFSTLSEAVARIAHGDYAARVPVKSSDEAGQLAKAFNQMAADVERHQKTAVEQERIRRELELGRRIQHDMLPQTPLTFGLTQVQGISVPAREVGGDFFNYFVLDNGHIALLMGDVSGKGVGAALLMANIQASLRIRLGLNQSLSDVANALDLDIEKNTPGPVYSTLFMALLDPVTRLLRFVNAGHNPQYVLRTDGTLERMVATGLPVGLLAGRGYTERTVQLRADDLLFLYTDGCVEVENETAEMFGVERLEALLLESFNAADPLHYVESALTKFRGRTEPMDDATLMTVKVG